jgi:hypothetical protein
MTVRPSRTSASNQRSGSPDARLRSHESHPKDRPTCADTGVDQAAAIPRISHDQRLTAASDGIWLQVRKQDQGHRSAPELAFCWWQVLGSNQRRLSRRFYIPEGAGRVKGGGVPVFLPVPGQVLGTPKGGPGSRWSARLDGCLDAGPPLRHTLARVRERYLVWGGAARAQFVSWAGSRLRSSLRGCLRLAAAGAWGGFACGQRDQSEGRPPHGGPVKPAITRCPRPGLLTRPAVRRWPGIGPARRAWRRRSR